MGSGSRKRRANAATRAGRSRSADAATRLGRALRDSRRAAGWTQAQVADRVGVSQPQISHLERGRGATSTLETWACVGAVVGLRLAAFFEAAPGASLPRDHEHLRRQELVIGLAVRGGWSALPEAPIDPAAPRSRSIDVLLRRDEELLVVEVWDLLDDVGAAVRGLGDKVAAVRRAHPGAVVAGVFVLRRTRRNRQLVGSFGGLFRSRFAGSGSRVIGSLMRPDRPLPRPPADALLWTDVGGTRLIASRLAGGTTLFA